MIKKVHSKTACPPGTRRRSLQAAPPSRTPLSVAATGRRVGAGASPGIRLRPATKQSSRHQTKTATGANGSKNWGMEWEGAAEGHQSYRRGAKTGRSGGKARATRPRAVHGSALAGLLAASRVLALVLSLCPALPRPAVPSVTVTVSRTGSGWVAWPPLGRGAESPSVAALLGAKGSGGVGVGAACQTAAKLLAPAPG